jgi:protein CpxP
MKTTWKKMVWMFVPILILGFVCSVSAQDIFRALGNERLVKELNLSPEQKENLKKVRFESREKMIDVEAQLQKARLQFDNEMEKEEVNREKVMEIIDVMGKSQTEMKKISVTQLIEAKKMLSPEQREKARDLIAKWKGRQERQNNQEQVNKPGRPDKPGMSQKPGQGPERIQRRKFAPQMPGPDQDRPRQRGDRSELMGFPHDSFLENAPDKNVAELGIPDPDFEN